MTFSLFAIETFLFCDCSWWCGRAGSKVSRLQAPVWTVQTGERRDWRPPDCYDQLGE